MIDNITEIETGKLFSATPTPATLTTSQVGMARYTTRRMPNITLRGWSHAARLSQK